MSERALKILFVVHGFPPVEMAGAEVYAYNLAVALRRAGQEVVVWSPGRRDGQAEYALWDESIDGIRVRRMQNSWRDLHSLADTHANPDVEPVFARLLDEEGPDLVHVHHVIGTSAEVIPLARARGLPVVVTLHDYWFHCPRGQRMTPGGHLCTQVEPWRCSLCILKKRGRYGFDWVRARLAPGRRAGDRGGRLGRLLGLLPLGLLEAAREAGPWTIRRRNRRLSRALGAASLILAPSRFLLDRYVEEGAPADRMRHWPYGMDHGRFAARSSRPARRGPGASLRIGFVGTLIPNKGPEVLLRAFGRLPEGMATLEVHGRGGGPKGREYEAGLRRILGARSDVHFHGPFDNRAIAEVLGALDLLCVPSIWFENAPLTLLESAMAGLPSVTSDLGGMREFAERHGTALTFPPGDDRALAAVFRRLAEEGGLLESLSRPKAPVRHIEEDAASLLGCYRELVPAVEERSR